MRRRTFFLSLSVFLAFCLLTASLGFADTVFKSDGSRVKGKIVKEDRDFVWVKTPYGTIKIDRYDIDRIEKGEEEEPAKQEPEKQEPEKQEPEKQEPEKTEPEKAEPEKPEEPAVEEVKKPAKPEEPAKPEKEEEPKDEADDELLGEENLKKLKEICAERMEAYQGKEWSQAYKDDVEVGGRIVLDLTCNSTKKVAKHYKWILGKLYVKYCEVFKAFTPADRKCNIFIHRNYTEFRSMRSKPPGVGGYYMPGQYQLVAFHGIMGTMSTDGILAHEGCHLFQDLIGLFGRGRTPIWVTEGMATLMEAAKIGKDGKIHIRGVSPGRLIHLQSKIKGGGAIGLSTLLNTSQREFSALHYAHAGMFTYWLIKGSKKNSLVLLYNDFVRNCIRGRGTSSSDFENLCKNSGASLSKLEPAWRKWVLKQKIDLPGKVVGNKFICDEYGFSVSAPGPGWKIDTKDTHGALCKMTHKDKKGYIFVSVSGTFGTPDIDEFLAMADQMQDKTKDKLQNYRRISRERKKFIKGTLDGYDSVTEYADTESPITKELQRRRGIAMSMVDTRYSVSCMTDPDKFDEYQQYFDKVVDSLRIDASKLE